MEKFFKKIVSGSSSMYTGDWKVSSESDRSNVDGLLTQAFGAKMADEDEFHSTSSGKVRSFISR